MSVYVIVQLTIKNRAAYRQYQKQFMAVFSKHAGRLLASDENPECVEGDWNPCKIILMEFPNKDSFQQWAFSQDYVRISADRRAGAEATVLLAEGLR